MARISGSGSGGGSVPADKVTYDNTASGLVATNAQAAIDELAATPVTGFDPNKILVDQNGNILVNQNGNVLVGI